MIDDKFLDLVVSISNNVAKRQYPVLGESHISKYQARVVITTFLEVLADSQKRENEVGNKHKTG